MANPEPSVPSASIVIPILNEEGNVEALTNELAAAMGSPGSWEVIFVDDGSSDNGPSILRELQATRPWLRVITHDRAYGQSAAIMSGAEQARSDIIVTLDGDLQNDPADIPAVLETYAREYPTGVRLVAGQRVGRQDDAIRKFSSRFANAVRSRVLKDATRDTGCSLKAMDRETLLTLPRFKGTHRFLPALFTSRGALVGHQDVSHRSRFAGEAKYGVWNRLWVGIWDLIGVHWLTRRANPPKLVER